MAKRRALARALGGLGEGAGQVGSFMLRQSLQDRSQDRYDKRARETALATADRQGEIQREGAAQALIAELVKNGGDPDQLLAALNTIGVSANPESVKAISPPRRRLEAGLGKRIADAKSLEEVPSAQDVLGDPAATPLPTAWSAGMQPAENDPFANASPDVRSMGERADVKRRAFRDKPTQLVKKTDETGATTEQMMSPFDMTQPIATSPTSEQQGVLAGKQEAAKQKGIVGDDSLTALTGKAQGRIAAMVDAMTRGGKVATAAAEAAARKRAELSPDIVQSEVDRANRIAAGKDNASQGERTAGMNLPPLINAHAKMLAKEAEGTRVRTGAQTATQYGLTNWIVPGDVQEYLQAGRDFVSTLGQIRSGVAVPESEVNRFIATMFATPGDTAQVVRNKQQSREVFIAAIQTAVGRSGEEAGRGLANAINAGQIPASILPSLQFSNPELQKALLANLKGVPQFDINGNVVGVK